MTASTQWQNTFLHSRHVYTFDLCVEPLVLGGIDAAAIIIDHVTFTAKLISPSPLCIQQGQFEICQCVANLRHSFLLLNNCQQFSDTISIYNNDITFRFASTDYYRYYVGVSLL